MPVILISVDSDNKNLVDFDKMEDVVVDVVLESTDPRSRAMGDLLSKKMVFINRIVLDKLNERGEGESEQDVAIRVQAALNVIRQMKVRNGVIISHHSVFNSYSETAIKDEWDVIEM